MHQTPMRLPPNLPIMAQHSAHRLRIHTMVCAASRFAILTATSCSSGGQGSRGLRPTFLLPHPDLLLIPLQRPPRWDAETPPQLRQNAPNLRGVITNVAFTSIGNSK